MTKCTGMRCPMQYGYKVEECNQTDCPYRTEPITNADRIRAMSDEELAEYVGKICLCSHIQDNDRKHCDSRAVCTNCIVEWLQQPAEADNG